MSCQGVGPVVVSSSAVMVMDHDGRINSAARASGVQG